MKAKTIGILPLVLYTCIILSCKKEDQLYSTWSVYRGDPGNAAYSSLDQINTNNVNQLELAWTYHTGDADEGNRSTIQCNPIIVNGRMYVTSPKLKLIALDASKGTEIWKFDPFDSTEATGVNRGVAYWEENNDRRIYFTAGQYLYAINADDGTIIASFGNNGKVDLREGLGREASRLAVSATTPGVIYRDILIQGSALGEGYDAAPGFIRAYNVKTGQIVWTFHTIPQPGEFGYDTWPTNAYKEIGGVNNWAGMSLDEKRGIVFVPTGSPAFDFYGGNRKGQNLFGNCLLAIDAATGKLKWHYQLVHHDLWDYDLPAPPNLITIDRDGKKVDAVAQVTKMGMVFVFDRETGEPIFPIEERPVPTSTLLGEATWPTQPFPTKPPPFARHTFSESEITDISPESNAFIKEKIKGATLGNIYTPPGTNGVVQFPGTRGGAEWGGASFDPEHGIMYVNANEVPLLVKMKLLDQNAESAELAALGQRIYTLNNCTMCHGADRAGTNVYPTLIGLSTRSTEEQIATLLKSGKGQMPPFPNLSNKEVDALVAFLFDKKSKATDPNPASDSVRDANYRYVHDGWNVLFDQAGYPGVKPPWGTLNAIDLNKGEILWKVPLGEYPELIAKGLPPTGTQNLGGSAVTAGGLVFIGATKDENFRAFDKKTGKILWTYKLPFGGVATPSIYEIAGKQYIVIAAGGGGRVGSPSGDAYVAFTLKK
ncbi:MAG TPA: PQQ-binding-like beta-propeller repeat protein [Chryseolinea sp.]